MVQLQASCKLGQCRSAQHRGECHILASMRRGMPRQRQIRLLVVPRAQLLAGAALAPELQNLQLDLSGAGVVEPLQIWTKMRLTPSKAAIASEASDVLGRSVRTLEHEQKPHGTPKSQRRSFDASGYQHPQAGVASWPPGLLHWTAALGHTLAYPHPGRAIQHKAQRAWVQVAARHHIEPRLHPRWPVSFAQVPQPNHLPQSPAALVAARPHDPHVA
mmetsp:Transcript_4169/g.9711  ORF Transcript_4169/g.9711 Transcript_4169/m.9711 type:complete len:217 (-) Transcript_4169:11-661(-)